ncbi:MAG: uroporphyrinogen decarboxylase, partial [Bdellovibrionales bacterium]|nr:uroporphyrinogen decarboxylase [Bdellovibrionales bacterium]
LSQYLDEMQALPVNDRKHWVCGLGHGVLPKTPEAHVKYFIEEVRRRFA